MMTVLAMIGADPELFLRDERTGGVMSGVGLIGGTKDKPLHMEGFLLQIDGVQQVETDTSLSPEDDEPLIHVQLGNSGTKARVEVGAAAD